MSIDADFTYIDGLEVANPTTGDPRSEGDDHLRGIKNAVKGTFPNIGAAAVTGTAAELNVNTGVTGGTVTASKTVVVDGSKDIGTFGTVTAATFTGTNVTGALDGILGGVTPAAITGTNITVAAGATITEFSTDGTMGTNSAVHVPTESAVVTYVTAQTPVYHEITNNTSQSISSSRASPTVIGTMTGITIPTKGRMIIYPDQFQVSAVTNSSQPVFGFQIGATEYNYEFSNNGSVQYGPRAGVVGIGQTDIGKGTWNLPSLEPANDSMSIVASGIPTGTQTVNLVCYDLNGFSTCTLDGDVLESTFTVIIESFI